MQHESLKRKNSVYGASITSVILIIILFLIISLHQRTLNQMCKENSSKGTNELFLLFKLTRTDVLSDGVAFIGDDLYLDNGISNLFQCANAMGRTVILYTLMCKLMTERAIYLDIPVQ